MDRLNWYIWSLPPWAHKLLQLVTGRALVKSTYDGGVDTLDWKRTNRLGKPKFHWWEK